VRCMELKGKMFDRVMYTKCMGRNVLCREGARRTNMQVCVNLEFVPTSGEY